MPKRKDPKVGTGKKPKGSGRRLYTDENPKDTVSIKFKTPADARATVAKVKRVNKSFAESIKTYLVNKTSNVWYQRYGELLKYVEEKGKARPPQTISIGSWCSKQRMDFKKGILSKEYIKYYFY